jgi:hypothetical protein
MADERYIEIPGGKTHELPPLLLHGMEAVAGESFPADLDSAMPEAEEMLAPSDADRATLEQRTFELALQLAEQYKGLLNHWSWGDSVLEWIRQCEITFESECALRCLLQPDVWPHAGRASFVTLLREKRIPTPGVTIERAVGLRLTFRLPQLQCRRYRLPNLVPPGSPNPRSAAAAPLPLRSRERRQLTRSTRSSRELCLPLGMADNTLKLIA